MSKYLKCYKLDKKKITILYEFKESYLISANIFLLTNLDFNIQ